ATLCTPADQSIVAGVKKLEPGHVPLARPGRRVRVEPYWDVSFDPVIGPPESDVGDQQRRLLEESMRLNTVSHVPRRAFLPAARRDAGRWCCQGAAATSCSPATSATSGRSATGAMRRRRAGRWAGSGA